MTCHRRFSPLVSTHKLGHSFGPRFGLGPGVGEVRARFEADSDELRSEFGPGSDQVQTGLGLASVNWRPAVCIGLLRKNHDFP